MTKEEIFKMAVEAGFSINELHCSPPIISFIGYEEHIEAFAKLIAEKEREECAKFFTENDTNLFWGSQVASLIRARGQE